MAATAVRRVVLEVAGWLLVVTGIAALVLPGPGMLMLFAGLALLSQVYPWARRLLHPVKIKALLGAAEGVETWPRVVLSCFGVAWLVASGVLWAWQPAAPRWWPLRKEWWLYGGRGVGGTLLFSSAIALALLVYSLRRFRGHPEEVEEVRAMERAHRRAQEHRRRERQSKKG